MNIEEFYDLDETRRYSDEVNYGTEWRSSLKPNLSYDLYWVVDTGELYLMEKPVKTRWIPVIGKEDVIEAVQVTKELEADLIDMIHPALHPRHMFAKSADNAKRPSLMRSHSDHEVLAEELNVEILASIPTRKEVEEVLSGWKEAMAMPDGLAWLHQRVDAWYRSSTATTTDAEEFLFIPYEPRTKNEASSERASSVGEGGSTTRETLWMPTELTRGPWEQNALHGGPVAALLAKAIEECPEDIASADTTIKDLSNEQSAIERMSVVRMTIELLRPVPLAPLAVSSRLARPGRRVQLVEASLSTEEQLVARATALRLRTTTVLLPEESRLHVSAAMGAPPPGPEVGFPERMDLVDYRAFHNSGVDIRFVRGAFKERGPATVWIRLRQRVVPDQDPTPLQRVMAASDFGNGISALLGFDSHIFINPDLTVYLSRMPLGEWVCLDASTQVESSGIGLAQSALWDKNGMIGRAIQSLLIEER